MADFVRCMHSKDSQMIALYRKTPIFKKSSGGLRRHYYFYLGFPPGTAAFRRRNRGGIILRGIRRQSRAATHQNNRHCNCCRRHPSRHERKCSSYCNEGNEGPTKPPEDTLTVTHLIGNHFCFAVTFLIAPFRSSFSLSISSPKFWAILSSFSIASCDFTGFPLEVVKAPSGFWFRIR